ncbi:hypothetical protein E4T44_04091 [Aureobasidium sp. EXF-8845]|nr:hypothetical protein E4T44_04091 [Aureobasidium sp. EXF-8845]KAI4856962.1 hypothetical protein E4T45_01556 [Aureobasidium sp. EXF-8846]
MTITARSGPVSAVSNNYNATLKSQSCSLSVLDRPRMDPTQFFKFQERLPPENFVPNSLLTTCDNSKADDLRRVMLLTLANKNIDITNSSAIICRPTYALRSSEVVYNNNSNLRTDRLSLFGSSGGSIHSFDPEQRNKLSIAIFNSPGSFLSFYNSNKITEAQYANTTMFGLMTVIQGRNNTNGMLQPFLDPMIMTQRATQVFSILGVQTIAQNLLVPDARQISGTATFEQERLIVDRVSAIVISVISGLVCCICAVLSFVRPWDVVPRRPVSVVDLTSLSLSSVSFRELLRGSGHMSDTGLELKLTEYCFSHKNDQHDPSNVFVVDADRQPRVQKASRIVQDNFRLMSWWHPWGRSLGTRLAVILLPLACIAVLEILQAKSDEHRGFVSLPNSEQRSFKIANYATQYLPAAVLISIKLLYGGLEDVVNIFAPFVPLKKSNERGLIDSTKKRSWLTSWLQKSGKGSYDPLRKSRGCSIKSLDYQVYGRVSLLTLLSAVKRRYWAVVFVSLTALLSPFLTIIVSGLYTLEQVPIIYPLSVNRTTGFNLTRSFDYGDDGGAGSRLIQIWDYNAAYPLWTYGDISLPTVNIDAQTLLVGNISAAQNSHISASLPGVRARLDCISTSNRTIFSDPKFDDDGAGSIFEHVPINVLNTCVGHAMPNMLSMNLTLSVLPEETYSAGVSNLNIFQPPNSSFPDSEFSPDNDADCPSLILYITKWSPLSDSKDFSLDYTALSCRQVVDEVQVNTTLIYPSMELAPEYPPTILEKMAPNVLDFEQDSSVKTWQVAFQFSKWANTNRPSGPSSSSQNLRKYQNVERYYQMVVNGFKDSAPIPLDDMLGESNIDVFVNATQRVYGMYMAQVFSGMKQDLTTPKAIPARMEAKAEWRVQQHKASKIALQIILGIMTVCGLLTWLCMDTEKVLPHNPCTIAGMASLFADSSLWDDGVSKEGHNQDCNAVELFGDCAVGMGWHDKVVGNIEDSIENVSESWFGIDRIPQQQHD